MRLCLLVLLSGVLLGCQPKPQVRVYHHVPVETQTLPMAQAEAPSAGHWTVPKGWQEKPSDGMRQGSFEAKNGPKPVDVSVVFLGGDAGGKLANVNRWLGQLNLAPISEAELSKRLQPQTLGGIPMDLIDLKSSDKRILAAMIQTSQGMWFVKLTGDVASIEQEKPYLMQFLGSMHVDH
ncbi:MAG: hypothetical protein AB7F28_03280 [Candidatus Margulisiibacteriota bacterium]